MATKHLIVSQGTKKNTNNAEKVSLYAKCDKQTAFRIDNDSAWCIDSGCTSHLCKDKDAFTNIESGDVGKLNLASDTSTTIRGKGSVTFSTNIKGKTKDIEINKALFVPDLRANLLSVSKITDRDLVVTFDRYKAKITDRRGTSN